MSAAAAEPSAEDQEERCVDAGFACITDLYGLDSSGVWACVVMVGSWIEEELYEEIRRRMPIPSVDVLPVYGGRLLLMRRSNDPGRGLWWTPGGRIRLGETLDQASARELAEETGLRAEGLEVRGVMCHFWPGIQFVTAFLRADVSSDEVRLNPEHSEHMWIQSCRDDLHPYVRYMIDESNIF